MVLHTCLNCLKTFKQKCNYTRHLLKKNKCKTPTPLNEVIYISVNNMTMEQVIKLLGVNILYISKEPFRPDIKNEVNEVKNQFILNNNIKEVEEIEEIEDKPKDINISFNIKQDEMLLIMRTEYFSECKKINDKYKREGCLVNKEKQTILKKNYDKNIKNIKNSKTLPLIPPSCAIVKPSVIITDLNEAKIYVEKKQIENETKRKQSLRAVERTGDDTESLKINKEIYLSEQELNLIKVELKKQNIIVYTLPLEKIKENKIKYEDTFNIEQSKNYGVDFTDNEKFIITEYVECDTNYTNIKTLSYIEILKRYIPKEGRYYILHEKADYFLNELNELKNELK